MQEKKPLLSAIDGSMSIGGNQRREDTPDGLRGYYRDKSTVTSYERTRYGDIRRSLPHAMECDVIDACMRQYTPGQITVLDLACGTGRLTRTLATHERFIVSADYAETMLAEADMLVTGEQVTFRGVRADSFHLPFDDAQFDVVFTMRFLRHFRRVDRLRCLSEIYRVLKPKGIVVFDAMNANAADKGLRDSEIWNDPLTKSQVSDELALQGFVLVQLVAAMIVDDPFFVQAKKLRWHTFCRWYGRRIRHVSKHVDAAPLWMVCAQTGKET